MATFKQIAFLKKCRPNKMTNKQIKKLSIAEAGKLIKKVIEAKKEDYWSRFTADDLMDYDVPGHEGGN